MPRVAIIAGARTPFVRAGGVFAKYSFLDLGVHAVQGLLKKSGLDPKELDELIFSTVLLDPRMPNAARELIIRGGLPPSIPAHFISNNCISGLVAVNMIGEGIQSGRLKVGLAGGSESMSQPALALSKKAEQFFMGLAKAKTIGEKLSALSAFKMKYLFPMPPSPKEPSTGLTMGQHCEITTKEFGIPRAAQDAVAFSSHQNAAKASKAGYTSQEIVPLGDVSLDNLVRADTSIEKLGKLSPVFDRSPQGTLTAGNSSSLTDGASAILLMSDEEAKRRGVKILGYIDGVEFSALHPSDGLLMAPGIALPRLFERAKLSIDSVDRFEIHEAFAAQVLANMEVWEKGWAKFPSIKPIGKVPAEKMNVNGGSIALGHPFAATGGRLILSLCNELERANLNTGVISVCAAGGMACAMLIRRS